MRCKRAVAYEPLMVDDWDMGIGPNRYFWAELLLRFT